MQHPSFTSRLIVGGFFAVALVVGYLFYPDFAIERQTLQEHDFKPPFQEEGPKSPEERRRTAVNRALWEFNLLKDPATGKIPRGIREKVRDLALRTPEWGIERNNANISITPRGPNNLGGRTRAIAFDKRNTSIILAGGVSSGVFRSTNGGTSWTKVSSNSEIHNVTAIVQDPRTGQEDTWYYGTGESSGNSASIGSTYYGHGVWKSTDNGLTWSVLSQTQGSFPSFDNRFDFVHRLVVDPTNGNVYAATSDVIMQSTNGGTNWTQVLGSWNNSRYTDIVVTSTGRLYAAFHGSDDNDGVWTSTTGASGSWTKIAGSGGTPSHANWNAAGAYGRVVLAIAPSNEDILYALYYNNTSSDCAGTPAPEAELFMWDNSSSTWTDKSANLPDETGCLNGNDPFACQGGYDLCVVVKPDNANYVYIGGTNAYRSTDAFTSTANTTRIGGYASPSSYAKYTNHHPDIHILTFAPGDNTNIYCGSDGGIHKADATAGTVSWTSLNNDYVTYQYYYVDIMPASGSNVVVGGLQDNGTTLAASGTTHSELFGGDGVSVGAISYTSSSSYNVILGFQNGGCYRVTGTNFYNIQPSGTSSSIFVTLFHLDQDNTNILYYADGSDLYRTRIASTLTSNTITGDAATGWEKMTGVATATGGVNIRSLATCRNDAHGGSVYSASDTGRRLYIGTNDGKVYRLDDPAFGAETNAPVDITPSTASTTSGTVVHSIATHPTNQNEILVAYSNYNVNSVYHTTDANAATPTWANVEGSGAVASGSAQSVIIATGNSQTLYFVGTSMGLYCTNTLNGSSTSWSIVGTNSIGLAVSRSMRYRPADYTLLLGTHGNGMFQLDLQGAFFPVEMVYFRGEAREDGNLLTWATASEVDNEHFRVEYSSNGKDYEVLDRVSGRGTAFGEKQYQFLHDRAPSGVSYYRLVQVDYNGQETNSDIVTIERAPAFALDLSPNPVSDQLTLRLDFPSENTGKVDIFDMNGRKQTSTPIQVERGLSRFDWDVSDYPAGTYLMRVQIGNKQYTEQFVKY